MHGSVEDGFEVAATGETISWDDVAVRLSAVNSALGNNLFVVACACHSQRLGPEARLTQPCPYYVLTAPERLVTADFLEEVLAPFYRAVFKQGDFMAACRRHLAPGFALFHSERLLLLALVRYVRRHCIGRGGGERRETLMDQAVVAGLPANRDTRSLTKAGIVPDQALVDRFVAKFLMGKHPRFDIDDVMRLARQHIERRAL